MMILGKFPIPPAPFNGGMNMHEALLRNEMNSFIDDMEFLSPQAKEKFKQQELGLCAARALPFVTDPQRLRPFNQLICFLVMIDDVYDYSSKTDLFYIAERGQQILNGSGTNQSDNGIFRLMAKMRADLLAFVPEEWVGELAASFYDFVRYGVAEEKPYKFAQECPPLPLFMLIREYSIGQVSSILLAAMANNTMLPLTVYKHPVVKRLITLNSVLAGMQNDFYSFPKEMSGRKGETISIIWVMQNEYNYTLEEAYYKAMDLYNAYLEEYLLILDNLPDFAEHQQDVVDFFHTAGSLLKAWENWYLYDTKRYAGCFVEPEEM